MKPGKRFTVCRIPLDGGAEEIVQDDLALPSFAIGRRALYFVRDGMTLYAKALSGGHIERLETVLMSDSSGSPTWETRFTVSPDGSTAIWVLSAPQEIDLAMQKFGIAR